MRALVVVIVISYRVCQAQVHQMGNVYDTERDNGQNPRYEEHALILEKRQKKKKRRSVIRPPAGTLIQHPMWIHVSNRIHVTVASRRLGTSRATVSVKCNWALRVSQIPDEPDVMKVRSFPVCVQDTLDQKYNISNMGHSRTRE